MRLDHPGHDRQCPVEANQGSIDVAALPLAEALERIRIDDRHLQVRIVRLPVRGGPGDVQRFGKGLVGVVHPPLGQSDLADHQQGLRMLPSAGHGRIGALCIPITHDVVRDLVEDVQAVDLIELVLEVAEHESDQVLGLLALELRLVARVQRERGQPGGDQHAGQRQPGHPRQFPVRALLLALAQFVEAHVQQAGDQLESGVGLAVLAGAHVGGDRFGAQRGQPAVGVELEAQRRGEAFLRFVAGHVAGVRLAVDDQAEHPLLAPEALELAHFLVDPARSRRMGRADHHQAGRLRQRLVDLAAEVVGAGQFVAVAEDRRQFFRDRPGRGLPPDQALRDRVGFQRLVQPRAPATVLVAVADEGVVLALRHRLSPGEDG